MRLPDLSKVPREALEAELARRKRGRGQPPKWCCCLRCRVTVPVSRLRSKCSHDPA
jgi:hypothetical protein